MKHFSTLYHEISVENENDIKFMKEENFLEFKKLFVFQREEKVNYNDRPDLDKTMAKYGIEQ